MPELPEVETTRRGLEPHLKGQRISSLIVRDSRLRWPVDPQLPELCREALIVALRRRAKYLLIDLELADGRFASLIVHLGMSGSLRICEQNLAPGKHDHVDIMLANGRLARYNDPRRFGSWHFSRIMSADESRNSGLHFEFDHWLLRSLGPEPLSEDFYGDYLYRRSRGLRGPVKNFIMNQQVVVGVGNIYANEALFQAGINPLRAAGRIAAARYDRLVESIQQRLLLSIEAGGTTLRDFVGGDGKPGYFAQSLLVYGRGGEACIYCSSTLLETRLNQRTTVYCRQCQR